MRWNTHRRILSSVLRSVDYEFPAAFVRGLLKGIIEPDSIPDYVYIAVRRRRRRYTKAVPARQHGGVDPALVKYYTHLALYHYRRGELYDAGRALGRAIHYLQDGVLKRTKWLILDIHERLEEEVDQLSQSSLSELMKACTRIDVKIKISNEPSEVLCYAIKNTYNVLKWFTSELEKDIDKASVMKRVRRARLIKTLVGSILALSGLGLLVLNFIASIFLFVVALIVASYTSQSYWEAFRAGLMKIKLSRYRTAM